ncbi:putative transcriptional regulator [Methanolinea mesophila]|uniref:helix-turn-helix transcriptional regulator n=1 Tax=Methanolinea mesophila TaxID=547055 RepID=UPI001AE3566A|nr:transcriptional regulator FilR1 domain-containing protein [Methanolinea mesophila]MBP1929816.1 putative transcriptional regulator [Methanolinea mesophila]
MDPLQIYERHHKLIHSIYSSRLKVQILLTLNQGNASLAHLRTVTGSTSQALIPKIRNLESQVLIEASNYEYLLTPLGKVVAGNVQDYVEMMGGIGRHARFWASHDLSGLPPDFLRAIGDLHEGEVKSDTTTDMFFVYSHYLEILKDAKYIHGISSVASPGLATFLAEKVALGVPVDLVVNDEVISLLTQDPYASNMKDLSDFPNFRIWVTNELLYLGLTVTDRHLSMGLYNKDRKLYDSASDLFSEDPDAVAWGERLFQHYKSRAEHLSVSSIFDE